MGALYIVLLCPREMRCRCVPWSRRNVVHRSELSQIAAMKAAMTCTPFDMNCERQKAAGGKYHRCVFAVPLCPRRVPVTVCPRGLPVSVPCCGAVGTWFIGRSFPSNFRTNLLTMFGNYAIIQIEQKEQ